MMEKPSVRGTFSVAVSSAGISGFFDNLTFPERVRDKRLGLIKHHMLALEEFKDVDIQIKWRKKMVTMKSGGKERKIAWYENDEIKMTAAAGKVEHVVNQSLKKWVAKRSNDPETDSD